MKIHIDLRKNIDESYDITFGDLPLLEFDRKVAIVTNTTIAKLHLQTLKSKVKAREIYEIILEDGEQYKNFETINSILNKLCEFRFDRKSLLIAFGGGVIGDMTGFAAAIYQRGIDFLQIPTTLLAMVDASVGGKTGVNNNFGKNLIGSFNQPIAVYVDQSLLKTLPKREFNSGAAEIVKMAATLDKDFFEFLESCDLNDSDDLQKAIAKSVKIKADIVSKDEKENGLRAVLNYGHTFGHIIELETGYSKFLHGECVAMGMVMANNLANLLNLITKEELKRINNLLVKFNLQTKYEVNNTEEFYNKFFMDKKTKNNKIRFVLPKSIGGFEFVDDAPKDVVIEAIKRAKI
ncbi:MAG: 3-dehydroquinate synthase [Helicobacteraceae bacterium]|nr:3-dehydroquinate synthase [Helicobacteraceae bacterium]